MRERYFMPYGTVMALLSKVTPVCANALPVIDAPVSIVIDV